MMTEESKELSKVFRSDSLLSLDPNQEIKVCDSVDPVYVDLALKFTEGDLEFMPILFKVMFNLEEARIVNELPAPAEEIAGKLNLDKTYVENKLEELTHLGKILKTKTGYKPFEWISQTGDIYLANPKTDKERDCPEYLQAMAGLSVNSHVETIWMHGGEVACSRVVPRWRAIKDIPGVMPCEDTRAIVKNYEGSLSRTRCVCRTNSRTVAKMSTLEFKTPCNYFDEEKDGTKYWSCMHLGHGARYFVDYMKVVPYSNVQEFMDIFDEQDARKTFQYHWCPNNRDVSYICNCCDDCCIYFNGVKNFVNSEYAKQKGLTMEHALAKSRFLSTIKIDKCNGCEGLERPICLGCQFGAIEIHDGKAQIDPKKCWGCGACAVNCPEEALKMKIVRPADHVPDDTEDIERWQTFEVASKPAVVTQYFDAYRVLKEKAYAKWKTAKGL